MVDELDILIFFRIASFFLLVSHSFLKIGFNFKMYCRAQYLNKLSMISPVDCKFLYNFMSFNDYKFFVFFDSFMNRILKAREELYFLKCVHKFKF